MFGPTYYRVIFYGSLNSEIFRVQSARWAAWIGGLGADMAWDWQVLRYNEFSNEHNSTPRHHQSGGRFHCR